MRTPHTEPTKALYEAFGNLRRRGIVTDQLRLSLLPRPSLALLQR